METKGASARLVLQQCISAKLQVKPITGPEEAVYVNISRGMVAFVCFLKQADQTTVNKMVDHITQVKLSKQDDGKLVSILDLPGDLLIVPQATLGGRLKGKRMQYHQNIDKNLGSELYTQLVEACRKILKQTNKAVECGTYGNLQVLSIQTNGPYTHIIDVS
uniref:D-aminoacyl-tRNA deacylase 2-like n=1 Tax=Ciona intestinalis TaxID=7719 RepID=UPI000180BF30|nr:D-aminoacyl-tRNA deacylase 2-like [Ciona intestinalis]|eukprot:XP_002129637.1 D-aminoacyl-tRNA deacylase 2-like [Ciona intestinalis]